MMLKKLWWFLVSTLLAGGVSLAEKRLDQFKNWEKVPQTNDVMSVQSNVANLAVGLSNEALRAESVELALSNRIGGVAVGLTGETSRAMAAELAHTNNTANPHRTTLQQVLDAGNSATTSVIVSGISLTNGGSLSGTLGQGSTNFALVERVSGPNFLFVASSSDGKRLVAVAFWGGLYTSTDAGTNWVERGTNTIWYGPVASSADGVRLVAVDATYHMNVSTDAGTNWTTVGVDRFWSAVASSADGMKLVATENGGSIYTSTDAGTNWTARSEYQGHAWSGVASSADGTRLVALGSATPLLVSTDAGTNWTARGSDLGWSSVASSADGVKLVAVSYYDQIYTSTDAGTNWTARGLSDIPFVSVASSADGVKLVALEYGGYIYTSADSGVTWARGGWQKAGEPTWQSVACSADGSRLLIAVGEWSNPNGSGILYVGSLDYVSPSASPITGFGGISPSSGGTYDVGSATTPFRTGYFGSLGVSGAVLLGPTISGVAAYLTSDGTNLFFTNVNGVKAPLTGN